MNTNINIEATRKLTAICPKKVAHFCRTAARLSGKLALREQFNAENEVGTCSSLAMAEVDGEMLNMAIIKSARDCADTLYRLNVIAKKHGIPEPLKDVAEMNLTGIIAAVNEYVTTLVGESDFRDWVADYEEP